MKNGQYESMEDFVASTRADGFTSYFAFGGDGNAKRACIGEGNQDDAILAIASCFLDRPDVEEIFQKAINVVNELKSEKK
jgi:hypothetical protein